MKQKPVYLPDELHKKLKIIAIEKGISLQEILSLIVKNAITTKKNLSAKK